MLSEQVIIFFQIVFIDLVLAGDNAIIIGMIASQFPIEKRKKIIFFGIGAAVILRIILTLLTAYLLQIKGLRLIGGLALLYIVYKLYVDVIKNQNSEENKIKVDNSSFLKAIWTILIADFTNLIQSIRHAPGGSLVEMQSVCTRVTPAGRSDPLAHSLQARTKLFGHK